MRGSVTVNPESLMPGQPQLFSNHEPPQGITSQKGEEVRPAVPLKAPRSTPVWLQRLSLFVLVLFCVYLGVLVLILPWWPRIWDHNMYIQAHPTLAAILHNGAVRGIISGLGLLDIWIGVSEAVHYRDHRD
jgi:hypothetical protein